MALRVLIFGGRDFTDAMGACAALDYLHRKYGIAETIGGGARGADTIGRHWSKRNDVPHLLFAADWNKHKKAAGFVRNSQMLTEGQPDYAVHFPGGTGTAHRRSLLQKANVVVWSPKVDYWRDKVLDTLFK
jgi:hypothetical protein